MVAVCLGFWRWCSQRAGAAGVGIERAAPQRDRTRARQGGAGDNPVERRARCSTLCTAARQRERGGVQVQREMRCPMQLKQTGVRNCLLTLQHLVNVQALDVGNLSTSVHRNGVIVYSMYSTDKAPFSPEFLALAEPWRSVHKLKVSPVSISSISSRQ